MKLHFERTLISSSRPLNPFATYSVGRRFAGLSLRSCGAGQTDSWGYYVDEAIFRLNEGNRKVDTFERMETLTGQIGNKRFRCRDFIKRNGLSSKVMPA